MFWRRWQCDSRRMKCIVFWKHYSKTILFGLTGTGYFDKYAYEKFHNGVMENYVPSDEEIEIALSKLPDIEG